MARSLGWQRLFSVSQKSRRRILGLMSGTSLDGVDLALTRIEGAGTQTKIELEYFATLPYPEPLTRRIQESMDPALACIEQLCLLHTDLGQFYAQLIQDQLTQWGEYPEAVDAIASHGHTIFHVPQGTNWNEKTLSATLQMGDGDQIAYRTGILTISDFRMKDIAAGGEGAPLIPYVDFLLFGQSTTPRALHNLGGISNLTYLPGSGNSNDLLAFDTGPANLLINLAVERLIDPSLHFDPEGQHAAKGSIHRSLLNLLMQDPFFKIPPPKSTGREYFGPTYLEKVLEHTQELQLSPVDVIATLTAFTAQSIQEAYHQFLPRTAMEIYFSGGGVHNKILMRQLEAALPYAKILTFERLGFSADAREAVSFAVLANELLAGNTITFPGITGNANYTSLGKISLP